MKGRPTESVKHELDAGDWHHRFAVKGEIFIVFAQAALMFQPSKGSFHDPAFGKQMKSRGVSQLLDNFQGPTTPALEPLDQFPRVPPIGPDSRDVGKPGSHSDEQQLRTIAILHIGTMHHHAEQ